MTHLSPATWKSRSMRKSCCILKKLCKESGGSFQDTLHLRLGPDAFKALMESFQVMLWRYSGLSCSLSLMWTMNGWWKFYNLGSLVRMMQAVSKLVWNSTVRQGWTPKDIRWICSWMGRHSSLHHGVHTFPAFHTTSIGTNNSMKLYKGT